MGIERKMYEETIKEIEEIGRMELGSEQYVKTVAGANSMVDRLNEAKKIENEARKLDIEEKKLEVEEQRLENDKKDRFIRNVMTGVTFVIGAGITIWANISSKRFEQGYTHTTEAGRTSTRKLLSFLDKTNV